MQCHDCGVERKWLHKHHILPRSLGGGDEAENLVSICSNCHEERHEGPYGGVLKGRLSNSPQAKAKKSETMKAKFADPIWRAKWEATLYKAHTPEKEANRTAGIHRFYAVPENRERVAEALREVASRPERNAKISATNKRLGRRPPPPTAESIAHARTFLGTPEAKEHHREALIKLNADPEFKARKSAKSKAMWADPEYAAKMNEMWGRGGETCGRGHSFSGDNLYIDARGRRVCRTCKAEASRRSRAKANPTAKVRGPYKSRHF